jgi:DnaJ homologue, subfamily C, member 28, conserved domain
MTLIDQLAEHRILQAVLRGELENLPGVGKPLVLDDETLVPEELRVGYRLLKNAGYLPHELQINKEIKEAEELLARVQDIDDRDRAGKRLQWLRLLLSQGRVEGVDLVSEYRYQEKLLMRL